MRLDAFVQLKEAYEQMQAQPTTAGSQGMSDESGTDNDSKVRCALLCEEWNGVGGMEWFR